MGGSRSLPEVQGKSARKLDPQLFSCLPPCAFFRAPSELLPHRGSSGGQIGGSLSSLQILLRECRRHSFLLCSTSRANLSPWLAGRQCSRWATLRPSNTSRASLD